MDQRRMTSTRKNARDLRKAQFGFGALLVSMGAGQVLARAGFCAISPGVWGLYRAFPVYCVLALAPVVAGAFVCARARRSRFPSARVMGGLRLAVAGSGLASLGVSVLRFDPKFVFLDAGFAACLVWACLFLGRGTLGRAVLAGCFSLSILFAASELTLRAASAGRRRMPDYQDAWQAKMGPGGHLKPDFHRLMAGATGAPILWVTNADGFRNAQEFERKPHPGIFRILYAGDSFFSGFRVGQQEHSGYLLEKELNRRLGLEAARSASASRPIRRVEVMVACVEDPVHALQWLATDGFQYWPDLVIYGFCLGNDVTQSYFSDLKKFVADYGLKLPSDASWPRGWPTRAWDWFYAHFFEATETGRALTGIYDKRSPIAIAREHEAGVAYAFDQVNGLGLFYKKTLPQMNEAFDVTGRAFDQMNRLAQNAHAAFVVAIIPQRFQVGRHDWDAAIAAYHLRPERFDLNLPVKRMTDFFDRQRVAYWDLRGAFAGATDAERYFCPLGDMHWNARGHALVANWMAGQAWPRLLAAATESATPKAGQLTPGRR
jgi:hypothetical protein